MAMRILPVIRSALPLLPRVLFILCAIAFTIKLLLQAGSVIPSLSNLAFGFRPIVTGYLHLVLLGVITLFIIAYVISYRLIQVKPLTKTGVIVFVTGIFLNEALLMIAGIADMNYTPLPFLNELLLLAALILFTGALVINLARRP